MKAFAVPSALKSGLWELIVMNGNRLFAVAMAVSVIGTSACGDRSTRNRSSSVGSSAYGALAGTKSATQSTAPQANKFNWVQVRAPGPAPALFGAMVYETDTRRLILSDRSNLWTWNGSTWAPDGSAHSGAALAYDPDTHQMVVFGGETAAIPPTYFSDTWIRNDSVWAGAWTQARPAISPPARATTTMAYEPGNHRVVLFGGFSTGSFGDTWTWNGSTWTQARPAASPPPRFGAAMAYDPDTHQMVLFGGEGLSDTWTWNGSAWTHATPATSPPGRQDATMAYDPDIHRMVLFGGMGAHNPLSDTWTWNGSTWTQVTPATSPPARYGAAMAYDPDTHQMVLFGGAQDHLLSATRSERGGA
jgi:Galactose oxidase, central domain